MTNKQRTLIKKYKEEFLKNKDREDIIEKAKGSLADRIEIAGELKERDDNKTKKATRVVGDFANQIWYKNSEIRKEFKILEYWRDSLMDEFQI